MNAKTLLAILAISFTLVLYGFLVWVSPDRAAVIVWIVGFIVAPFVIMFVNDRKRGTK